MNKKRAGGLALLAATGLAFGFLLPAPQPILANHQCANTGSPFGPFEMEAYEAADYRTTYARTLELAGFNQLFPELPSFGLPRLESGQRTAGSGQSVEPLIPPVLLKAIASLESSWAQADYSVPYGAVGPVLASHDCGYGIMQVTTGMQNVSGVPNLDQAMIGGHFAFNIARGAHILADKWNLAPELRPIVGSRDPLVIDNWYYAVWGYNGFAFKNHPLNPDYELTRPQFSCGSDGDGLGHDRSQYPYQEMVLGCLAHPPARGGSSLWDAQEVRLPNLSDPQVAGPLKLENWNPCSFDAQCAAMDLPSPGATPTSTLGPDGQTPASTGQTPVLSTATAVSRAEVIGSPVLNVSQDRLELAAVPPVQGSESPLTISNGGTGVLAWRATTSAPWLKLSRYQGVALGTDLNGQPSTITVGADAAGLPPGRHTAQINIESLYAAYAPQSVSVAFQNYPDGTLIKGSGPSVYAMRGGVRRPVPNAQTFEASGWDWNAIVTLPNDAVALIPAGSMLPDILADGNLVKGSGYSVFVMQAGSKRPIASADVYVACGFGWDAVKGLADVLVDSIPTGALLEGAPCPKLSPSDGSLLVGGGAAVYVIRGGLKRVVLDPVSFEASGYSWGNIDRVSDSVLASLTTGQPMLDAKADGNLLKGSSAAVFAMQAGARRPISGAGVLDVCGYGPGSIRVVSDVVLEGLPVGDILYGAPCPRLSPQNGALVKGSGPAVYVVESGLKRAVTSADVFLGCGYLWGNVNSLPDGVLALIADGAPLSRDPCPRP